MIEIISKPNGPRKEDAAAKHFLRENSGTIMKIANQLSGGRLRERPLAHPKEGSPTARRTRATPSRSEEARPYTSVSLNGRVVVVDFHTGRQLHHIGEIRGHGAGRRFLLATTDNGFFSPLEPELQKLLLDLDKCPTADEAAQDDLAKKINARLGFSSPE